MQVDTAVTKLVANWDELRRGEPVILTLKGEVDIEYTGTFNNVNRRNAGTSKTGKEASIKIDGSRRPSEEFYDFNYDIYR